MVNLSHMATRPALLCFHRDLDRMRMLQKNGYKVLTAANSEEGLQLFGSQPVDAIVLEYSLARREGSVIASEIKRFRPSIPIVMLAEHAELPEIALESVDVLVSPSDPPYFLWAAVHFALNVSRVVNDQQEFAVNPIKPRKSRRLRGGKGRSAAQKTRTSTIDRTVQF